MTTNTEMTPASDDVLTVCVTGRRRPDRLLPSSAHRRRPCLRPQAAAPSPSPRNHPGPRRPPRRRHGARRRRYPLLRSVLETDDAATAFADADRRHPRRRLSASQGHGALRPPCPQRINFQGPGCRPCRRGQAYVRVVVVGNPANTNALILADAAAPKIPRENITALTRLDHNRTRALVAERSGVPIDKVSTSTSGATTPARSTPDVSRATADGVSVKEKLGGDEKIALGFIPIIQKRGAAVIAARGSSSAMSAANAVADHMRSWMCGDSEIVSMAVPSDGSYGVQEGLYFSFPVRCIGGWKYEIVPDLEIDPFSKQYMDATVKELLDERTEALTLVKAML